MNRLRLLYYSFFPFSNCYKKWKLWDKVWFAKYSICVNTYFEGKNALHAKARVFNSYIGLCTYIGTNSKLGNTKVGRFCSIADHVRTGFGTHPTKKFVSSFPSFYYDTINLPISFMRNQSPIFNVWNYVDEDRKYLVEIGNDVWIGSHVLIMDGVKIGDGAIVAAGAVVTKDVAPYSIVGGVPAKHIKYRFNDKQIDVLLNLKWWDKDLNWIEKNSLLFRDINILCSQSNLY